ncbi:hypothetical protein D5085_16200 [Ectothiorhodospiraceae bacterium BW-2]|nr:hypothetical protein D5085_16200 [Ectothiorhodospiraceae bacterium BW-2]
MLNGSFHQNLHQNVKVSPHVKLSIQKTAKIERCRLFSGRKDHRNPHYQTQPVRLVEVLFKSTRFYDKHHKADIYRTLPSL